MKIKKKHSISSLKYNSYKVDIPEKIYMINTSIHPVSLKVLLPKFFSF